jgi:uncharacterized protein YndB with AHSA1/START domain
MARNEIFVSVPPEQAFAVLADPNTYADWVVGTQRIRGADSAWPTVGSDLDHSVGIGPLTVDDATTVLDAEPPVMLKLQAKARPFPSATITFWLQPEAGGTRVTMIEAPSHPLLSLLIGPLGHGLLGVRNREALRRFKEIAEGTRPWPSGDAPHTRERASASAGTGG